MVHYLAKFTFLTLAFAVPAPAAEPGRLVIATPILPSQVLSPYQGLALPSIMSSLAVFDPLTVIDRDGQVRPWLARAWTSADGRVWTVTLRDDVAFSNGAPLTAKAIVASIAHMQSAKGRAETVGSSLANIAAARALDAHRAEVTLKEPDAMFPMRMALWKLPEPEGWRRLSADDPGAAVGTGPFMFAAVEEGRVTLAANPRAWNAARVPRLQFIQLQDQIARVQAILSGGADIALQLGVEDRAVIEAGGGTVARRAATQVRYIAFATEHMPDTPVRDVRVRLALNHAVDRARIIATLLDGQTRPVDQLVLPGAPGHDPAIAPFAFDPARARALLAEAGHANGLDLTVRMAAAGADDATVFQQVAADLRAVGVNLSMLTTTQAQMTPLMFQGAFGTDMFINFARGLDPLGDYRFRSCLGLAAGHKPFFCDAEALPLVERARTAPTLDQAAAALRLAIRRERDNPPGIFLWETTALDGFGPRAAVPSDYAGWYEFLPLHALALR
ncbi:MAG: ABC transporter substrate-binding protein [Rhodospirillaceae bacterium]|nr:ABC transporter substrate-binding protein [Rhodospirillaceae bacterium]